MIFDLAVLLPLFGMQTYSRKSITADALAGYSLTLSPLRCASIGIFRYACRLLGRRTGAGEAGLIQSIPASENMVART